MNNEEQINADICRMNENNLETVLFSDYGSESLIVTSDVSNGLPALEGALCYDESTNEFVYVNMIQSNVNNSDNMTVSQSVYSALGNSIPSLSDLSMFNEGGQFMLLANGSIVIPNDEDNLVMTNSDPFILEYVLNPSDSNSGEKHVISVNSKPVDQDFQDFEKTEGTTTENLKKNTDEIENSSEPGIFENNNSVPSFQNVDDDATENKHQKTKRRYHCKLCLEKFSSLKEYKIHLLNHHKDKMYKCKFCGNSFNKQKNLILHEAIHNIEDTVCPITTCQKKFKRLASLKAHIKLHEEEDALTCPKCGEEFLNQLYLELHFKYQLQCRISTPERIEKSLQCKLCDRKFEFVSQFLMHKKEHAKIKKALATKNHKKKTPLAPSSRINRCKMCPKWFLKPSQLIRHMRIHTGERPFECTVCNKAFNQANSLKTHMLKHTGDRPYNCPFCSTGFSQRGNLRQHIHRVHSIPKVEEHVYECIECSCIFKKLCSLNAHKNRVHQKRYSITNENSKTEEAENSITIENGLDDLQDEDLNELLEKKNYVNTITVTLNRENGSVWNQQVFINKKGNIRYYRCSHCPKQSIKLKEIIRHLKFNILGRPFKCDYCSITFSQHSTFLTHLTLHANAKTFRCNICQKNFFTQSALKMHSSSHEKCEVCFKTCSQDEIACHECLPLMQNLNGNTKLEINEDRTALLDVESVEKIDKVILTLPSECNFCDLTYSNFEELKQHLHKHNAHLCELCYLLFPSKETLHKHTAGHQEETSKIFACDECAKTFNTIDRLNVHLKSHTGMGTTENVFHCSQCSRTYKDEISLKRHIKRMHKVKNQDFSPRLNVRLKSHARMGSTENEFHCSQCSKTYKDEISLKRHIKRMHKVKNQDASQNFSSSRMTTLIRKYNNGVPNNESDPNNIKTANVETQIQNIALSTTLQNPNSNQSHDQSALSFIGSDNSKVEMEYSINADQKSSRDCLPVSSNEIPLNTKSMSSDLLNVDPLEDCFFDIQTGDMTMVQTETDPISNDFCFPGAIIYRCTKCFVQYASELDLQKHFQESKTCNNGIQDAVNSYFYSCNTCFLTFKCLSSFLRHLQTHDGSKSFSCLRCGSRNKTQAELTQHIAQHAVNNEYFCIHCGELSDCAERVKQHIIDIHLMSSADNRKTDAKRRKNVGSELLLSDKEKKMLACQKPNKYSSISEKVLSSLLKTPNEKDKCVVSDDNARVKNRDTSKISKTNRSTSDSKENKCSYCGRGFKKMSDLVRHIRTHTGEKPFKCDYCNKCFRVKSILNCHLKTHFTVNNIFCHICNRFFSTVSSLKIHMRLHTGDRPYKCLYCKETFRTSGHRDSHQKRHTSDKEKPNSVQTSDSIMIEIVTVDEASDVPQTPYGLSEMSVGENFKLQDINLVGLQISTDLKQSSNSSVCGKSFKTQSDLSQYMNIDSSGKSHVCRLCNAKFSQLDTLKTHLRLHNTKTDSSSSMILEKNSKLLEVSHHLQTLDLPIADENNSRPSTECGDIVELDRNQWVENNHLNLSNLVEKRAVLKKCDNISDFYVMDKQFDLNYMIQDLFPDDVK